MRKLLLCSLVLVAVVTVLNNTVKAFNPLQVMTNYLCDGHPTDMYGNLQDPLYWSAIFQGPNEVGMAATYSEKFTSYVKKTYGIAYFKTVCLQDSDSQKLQNMMNNSPAGTVFTNWTPQSK
jgi:hypothetical protein